MSIQANEAARETAEECFELISQYVREQQQDAEVMGLAWKKLGDMVEAVTNTDRTPPEPPTSVVMSDDQARRFERQQMQFGRYSGDVIADVPLSYLVWLEEQPDFRKDLNRYLRRREMQEQQDKS